MPSRTFTIDELEKYGLTWGSESVVFTERVGSGRWSEYFKNVFRADDEKLYLVSTEEGLTENQELGMYREDHYPDRRRLEDGSYVVDCPEVELYEELVPVTKYMNVV